MAETIEEAMEIMRARANQLSVALNDGQLSLVQQYCLSLAEFNSHTNLVSDASPLTLVQDHIVDALTLVKFIENFRNSKKTTSKKLRLLDIGSGAGLPGLILAIVLPYLEVTLIDSVGKKIKFLDAFIEQAHLGGRVRALAQRSELMAHQQRYREKFDIVTARAVGSFDMVAELALPFLSVGGELYAQKSLSQLEEASAEAARTLPLLGGALVESTVLDAAVLGKDRVVIVAAKRFKTSIRYPRAWVQIKTCPLAKQAPNLD